MKVFKVHNAEKVKQEVNLPAGTYTYSFRVLPVGTSYTFRLDNQSFTLEGLTAGILNKRMKYTFELTEAVSFFYLSNTVGDCVYEPQIEEGIFATTPGAHTLDFERLISETGIDIDSEVLSLYAKKTDVTAEINITADRIDSTVGNISNDIDGIKSDVATISQTVNSITSTVTNHTSQISRFQQTVDQIYLAIDDVGSGEFASIIQRLDEIELKVGAAGQDGSIQLALDSIALTVYDENTGMSAINQKVGSITATVTNHTSQIATFQQTVDQIYLAIEDVGSGEFASITTRLDSIELKVGAPGQEGSIQAALDSISSIVYDENTGMSAINQKVGSITATVANHTSQISTFQQTVDEIYLAIEDVGSGEFASIIQRLNSIEVKVGAQGQSGSIQVAVDSVTTRVEDIDFGLTEVVQTVGSITATVADNTGRIAAIDVKVDSISSIVYDENTGMSAINQKIGSIALTVADNEDKVAELRIDVNSISSTVSDVSSGMSQISQTVNSITSTVTNHTSQIATFQQTVDEIYLAIEDAVSGEYSSIIQRLNSIELKVGAPGQEGSIQVALDSISSTVSDVSSGMSQISQTVDSISSTVYDEHGTLLSQISQDGSNILIQGTQIDLRGATTINDNFKVLEDGSIEAKNGNFTGIINALSGSIGHLTVEELGRVVMKDPATATERLIFANQPIPTVSYLESQTQDGGSRTIGALTVVLGAPNSSSSVLNVTQYGSALTFGGTTLNLQASAPTGQGVTVQLTLTLERNNTPYATIGGVNLYVGSGQTASDSLVVAPKTWSGVPSGNYRIKLERTYLGTLTSLTGTSSESTLSWAFSKNVDWFQFGLNGMMSWWKNLHAYFSDTEISFRAPSNKFDAPGVLGSGSIISGSMTKKWGTKINSSSVVSGGFRITLQNMTHSDYAVIVTPHTSTTFRVGTKTNTYFEVFGTGNFDFAVFGNNY